MSLSPGQHSVKYYQKGLKRRLDRQLKASLPSTKRRRLVLKQERATNQGAQETLEGVSYQSGYLSNFLNATVDQSNYFKLLLSCLIEQLMISF